MAKLGALGDGHRLGWEVGKRLRDLYTNVEVSSWRDEPAQSTSVVFTAEALEGSRYLPAGYLASLRFAVADESFAMDENDVWYALVIDHAARAFERFYYFGTFGSQGSELRVPRPEGTSEATTSEAPTSEPALTPQLKRLTNDQPMFRRTRG